MRVNLWSLSDRSNVTRSLITPPQFEPLRSVDGGRAPGRVVADAGVALDADAAGAARRLGPRRARRRRAADRPRPHAAGAGGRLRQGAQTVRRRDRHLPGRQAPARRRAAGAGVRGAGRAARRLVARQRRRHRRAATSPSRRRSPPTRRCRSPRPRSRSTARSPTRSSTTSTSTPSASGPAPARGAMPTGSARGSPRRWDCCPRRRCDERTRAGRS